MIRNIVFDLGQVIYAFTPEKYMLGLGYNKEETAAFLENKVFKNLWNEYDRGMYTRAGLIAELVKHFPEKAADIPKILGDDFVDNVITIMSENLKLFYEMKERGFTVYILSNIFEDGIAHLMKRDAFLRDADGIIASAHHKINKPDHGIYRILFDKYDLVPGESVFIDDRADNVAAARELGMAGIHFTHLQDCKEQLNKIIQSGGNFQ